MAKPTSLEQARAAKAKVTKLVGKHPDVNGIGIARMGVGYGVKLNLRQGTLADQVPGEIDGVPVWVETVGPIKERKRGSGSDT